MYYVYLLRNRQSHKFYVGQTNNLQKRFSDHIQGLNKSTKSETSWDLVYYEAYRTRQEAVLRERRLKHHGKGLAELKKRLTSLVHD